MSILQPVPSAHPSNSITAGQPAGPLQGPGPGLAHPGRAAPRIPTRSSTFSSAGCIDIGFELYPAQEEALLEIMAGRHVILNTPTGSGKSLVAMGMHFKAMCEGKTCFYTSPIKALASEKFFGLCDDLGPANVGMQTGDASINPEASIICATSEVLANRAPCGRAPTAAPTTW